MYFLLGHCSQINHNCFKNHIHFKFAGRITFYFIIVLFCAYTAVKMEVYLLFHPFSH